MASNVEFHPQKRVHFQKKQHFNRRMFTRSFCVP